MAKIHPVEKELVKATGFKKDEDDYKSRQDYLAALAKDVNKLADDDFNAMSDEATDWSNNALDALKKDEDIDDFEDGGGKDEEKEEKTSKRGRGSKDDDDAKSSKRGRGSKDDDDDKKSSSKRSRDDDDDKKSSKRGSRDKDDDKKSSRRESAKRDRYGLVVDSKVSDAVRLFEKGASMKTIKEKTGGPQNNVLKKLIKDGHLVERYDGIIKVTHKDDLTTKQKNKVRDLQESGGTAKDEGKGESKRSRDDDDGDKKSSGRRGSRDDDDDKKSSKRGSKDDDDDRGSRRRGSKDDDDNGKSSRRGSSKKDDDDDRGSRRRR